MEVKSWNNTLAFHR